MQEYKGLVTAGGNPLTLVGNEVKVGDAAPDATLYDNSMAAVQLSSWKGKVVILASVPSLDTPVCDTETRKFNEAASKLPGEAHVLTVSMDLPFAQARWCGAAGVQRVKTLSDYREAAFGTGWGLLIKELHLLARAVFVIDRNGVVRYKEVVKELGGEPNYEAALNAARELA